MVLEISDYNLIANPGAVVGAPRAHSWDPEERTLVPEDGESVITKVL